MSNVLKFTTSVPFVFSPCILKSDVIPSLRLFILERMKKMEEFFHKA